VIFFPPPKGFRRPHPSISGSARRSHAGLCFAPQRGSKRMVAVVAALEYAPSQHDSRVASLTRIIRHEISSPREHLSDLEPGPHGRIHPRMCQNWRKHKQQRSFGHLGGGAPCRSLRNYRRPVTLRGGGKGDEASLARATIANKLGFECLGLSLGWSTPS
jgi:hypothetical protein